VISDIFFFHIPKTAGTSLRGFLEGLFDHSYTSDIWFVDSLISKPPEKLNNLQIIAGHFPVSTLNWIPIKNFSTITFLRHPIQRSISHFNHLRSNQSAYMHHASTASDIEGFLTTNEGLFEMANLQTRYLGSISLANDFLVDRNLVSKRDADSCISGPNIEHAYKRALNFIEKCDVLGIMEKMNESMQLIAHKFVLSSCVCIGHANRAVNSHDLVSESVINKLSEINKFDLKLYDEANSIFNEKISGISSDLIEDAYLNYMKCQSNISSWYFSPDKSSLSYGWHGREFINDTEWARWSAVKSAFIDIPNLILGFKYKISFRIGFYSSEQKNTFSFFVNGIRMDLDFINCDPLNCNQQIFQCILDDSCYIDFSFIRLEWSVDFLVNPAKQFGELDNRDLGVYLWWCSIEKLIDS
jgi:hypothetical protein